MTHEHPRFLVTGANGGLGSAVVAELLKLVPADDVAISVRDPDLAERFVARGVRVRRGDFDDRQSLVDAFEGAERVLVISTRNADNNARFIQQKNAIDAAQECGVAHVYYTSIIQRPGTPFEAAPGHHATEDYLAALSVKSTIFRNGNYIENLPLFLGSAMATGVVALPEDGPTAWVARQDLAEGIASTMLFGEYAGQALSLTGPQALSIGDIAAMAGNIADRRIERRIVDAQAYINALVSRGMPTALAVMLASGFESRARGELAQVDPTLAKILQRPLQTVSDVLPRLLSLKEAA